MGLTVDLYRRFISFQNNAVIEYETMQSINDLEADVRSELIAEFNNTYSNLLGDMKLQLKSHIKNKSKDAVARCNDTIILLKQIYESTCSP